MSEIDINRVIPAWFISVVEAKVGSASARRKIVMQAEKVTAKEAVRLGIVDSAHDSAEDTVKAALVLAVDLIKRGWDGHVYADNRKKFLSHVIRAVEDTTERNIESKL
jgi:enoyl-CoA hydratase/carnithine racemase